MEELLRKALEEVYEKEFEKYKVTKRHFFSFRHRRKMRKLFKQLENKSEQSKRSITESDKDSESPVEHDKSAQVITN